MTKEEFENYDDGEVINHCDTKEHKKKYLFNSYLYEQTGEILNCQDCKYFEAENSCLHDSITNSDIPKIIHFTTCGLFESNDYF